MVLIKKNNKLTGYQCDKCKVTPRVIYADEEAHYCEKHAISKYNEETVKSAVLED